MRREILAAVALAGALVAQHRMGYKAQRPSPGTLRLVLRELPAARRLASQARRRPSRGMLHKQINTDGLPGPLGSLAEQFAAALRDLTADLEAGRLTPQDWAAQFEILLARYHTAGYLAGAASDTLTDPAATFVGRFIDEQMGYLQNFTVEIQGAPEWQAGWTSRAESYAAAIKVPYWKGETKMLPLPAMPAEGTNCLNNCGCKWRVEPIDEEAGDYDAYWERNKDDSCQTCLVREREWSPVRIRGGRLL